MKITMSLTELNTMGKPFAELQKIQFDSSAMAIYDELEKFLDKFETLNKMLKKYREENAEDKKTIHKYGLDQNGEPVTDEIAKNLELETTPEWKAYMKYIDVIMDEEFTLDITPVIGKSQATKMTMEQLHIAKRLGMLIRPTDKPKTKKGAK